jgi:hypothetical protein
MQLPRVVIAGVFFVIGLLIAVPPLVKWATRSDAASPSASPSGSPSGSPSASPTGTKSPKAKKTPVPVPTAPLAVTIGGVSCPSREVKIEIHNNAAAKADYVIKRDDGPGTLDGSLQPGATRSTTLTLREDKTTNLRVTSHDLLVKGRTLKANCKHAHVAAPPAKKPDRLPHTGPDDGVLWARGATGAAALITGAIILWYGGVWPRRREKMFAKD